MPVYVVDDVVVDARVGLENGEQGLGVLAAGEELDVGLDKPSMGVENWETGSQRLASFHSRILRAPVKF